MDFPEITVSLPDPFKDALIQKLTGLGSLGVVEEANGFTAYFPQDSDMHAIRSELELIRQVLEKTGVPVSIRYSTVPDRDWNKAWKEGFKPIDIGRNFTVLPPWEHPSVTRLNLIIDPAMAFGTGHHATTRSCLVLIEQMIGEVGKNHFLDLGTGTGILAIAASKLGFSHVTAVDVDPLAVDAALHNSALNNAENIRITRGSVDDAAETYDLIAANLIATVLVRLAADIASRLAPAGRAIFSGILEDQAAEVLEAAKKAGLVHLETVKDATWITLALGRESSGVAGRRV